MEAILGIGDVGGVRHASKAESQTHKPIKKTDEIQAGGAPAVGERQQANHTGSKASNWKRWPVEGAGPIGVLYFRGGSFCDPSSDLPSHPRERGRRAPRQPRRPCRLGEHKRKTR